jgi:hypothetical protein
MKRYYIWFLVVALIAGATSCKKTAYLTDGGVHTAITPLSTYDYLAQHPWHLFDTLVTVINHYGLKDRVNEATTFFAPTNYSIGRYMTLRLAEKQAVNPAAAYTLDSLFKDMKADSVLQYMFNDKITLDVAQELKPKLYPTKVTAGLNMGVMKEVQTVAPFVEFSSAPTFLLYLVKVRGAIDEPGVIPPANESDIRVVCQTTGILPDNGARVLHVLSNLHTFGRF